MKKYLYGVDLGGTSVKIGLFTEAGDVIDKFQIPTRTENNGEAILSDIASAIETNQSKHGIEKDTIKGIGIGVPGPVTNGVVNRCVNLGWGIVPVEKELSELTGLPVRVSNDANIAGLGELWKGGAEGYENIIFITLGTGVGGAVIVDGKVVDGFVGGGGEIGHVPLSIEKTGFHGFQCNCGNKGCLETVASATGVVRVANELLKQKDDASVLRDVVKLSAKDVFDAAKHGDTLALEVVNYFGENLGFICAVLGSSTNPEAFVFGGGVSKAGSIITETIQKHFKHHAFYALKDSTKFILATLGNDAGIYGAAYLARSIA